MRVLNKPSKLLIHIGISAIIVLVAAGLSGNIHSAAAVTAEQPVPPANPLTFRELFGSADDVQADFQITTTVGIDNYLRYEYPFNVQVNITNNQEDFTGTLRLIPARSSAYDVSPSYGQDMVLSQGEQKRFTIEVPTQGSDVSSVLLQITDSRDQVVYTEKIDLPFHNGSDFYVMGILSDDFSALNYFDGRDVLFDQSALKVRLLELDEENIPENGEALKICQMILINSFDTARLSDRQYQALKEWVNDGGVLMIGTGADYQNVFNKFDDGFISGTIGSLSKTTMTIYAGHEVSIDSETSADNEISADNEASADSENSADSVIQLSGIDVLDYQFAGAVPLFDTFTGAGGKSLEHVKEVGLGRVIVLGYNLGMEPLYSFSGRTELAQMLISKSLGGQTSNWILTEYGWDAGLGSELPGLMDNPRKPSQLLYGLLFVAYAVIVGPILYLILKKNKRQEKLWLMICAVALIFTGLVYLSSFYYRIRNPIINNFAVIRLSDSMKEEDVKSEIIIPDSKALQLSLDAGYRHFVPHWNHYGYGDELTGEYQYTVKNGENIVIDFEKLPSFQSVSFDIKKLAANDVGTLDIDIEFQFTGEFSGTITNNTNADLQEVTISFFNNAYFVGYLGKGQTHEIKESEIKYAAAAYDFTSPYDYDIYSTRALSEKERKRNYAFSEIQYYMWLNYVNEALLHHCTVWGIMENYEILIASDSKLKQNSGALVLQQHPITYQSPPEIYIADISDVQLSSSDSFIVDYGVGPSYLFDNNAAVTYDFGTSDIDTLWIDRRDSSYIYADIFAYNPETELFEQLFDDVDGNGREEVGKYLVDGRIILQYCYPYGIEYAYIPTISAWKEGE